MEAPVHLLWLFLKTTRLFVGWQQGSPPASPSQALHLLSSEANLNPFELVFKGLLTAPWLAFPFLLSQGFCAPQPIPPAMETALQLTAAKEPGSISPGGQSLLNGQSWDEAGYSSQRPLLLRNGICR